MLIIIDLPDVYYAHETDSDPKAHGPFYLSFCFIHRFVIDRDNGNGIIVSYFER